MRYLSEEELQLASYFIFLSMAITVLEQDVQHIKRGKFKIKEPYLNMLGKIISEAFSERRRLRVKMKRKDIKVVMVDKSDLFSSFLFICQGREEQRNYFNPAIKLQVKQVIQKLLKGAQKDPQSDLKYIPSTLKG